MKHLLYIGLFISALTSCRKDKVAQPDNQVPEQNYKNVSYGSDPAQVMDIYLPKGRNRDSTWLVVMVHGGAWSSGDKSDFTQYISDIQHRLKQCAVANINYRLATPLTNHFPIQEKDMKAAVDFLVSKSEDYQYSQKIILLGASSGGHQVTLQAYKYASPKISAVIDFFAPVDMVALYNAAPLASAGRQAIQLLVGGTPANNPAIYEASSPIHFVNAASPPTIILHGGMDQTVNISQSVALKNKLDSVGVANQLLIYPNEGHNVWPDAIMNEAFSKIEAFVKANVH
jgi:acetyl esterase/lipase